MKRHTILLTVMLIAASAMAKTPLYKDPKAPVEARVQDLLERMTREEKLGQLRCPFGWPMYYKSGDTLRLSDGFYKAMDEGIGNFWGVLRADPWTGKTVVTGLTTEEAQSLTNQMQRYAVEQTRLGIPLLLAEEAVHGVMAIGTTVMPTGMLQASTFDTALMRRMGEVVGSQVRTLGGNVGYGPVVDIAREPRWSRVEETMGEDPWLTGEMAAAVVRGMQGEDIRDGRHVWSVLKHFAAYGIPEGGLNGEQANIGTRRLIDEYLPQFRNCVEAGAGGIMTSYNSIDGVPCTANRWLLTEILREKWGFSGMVYSDLLSIEGIAATHHVARDYKEAARMAMEAGVDIDLQGNAYALMGDDVMIDSAVARVLRMKIRMGLFENPYNHGVMGNGRETALEVARKGVTLLKNDGILPLRNIGTVAVIGPNADNVYNQLGDYTAPQAEGKVVTVLQGLRKRIKDVRYVKGCGIRDMTESEIERAVEAARSCEVTVLVVGGSSSRYSGAEYMSTGAAKVGGERISDMECGEGFDRADLGLMGDQKRLMEALLEAGVKLVVVYIEGRPLEMNLAAERADALLAAWYPGEMGGEAIAEILTGEVNPSGRLPVSIPRNVGQLPVYYSKHWSHDYVDSEERPLYEFGYGLSYTEFEYSELSIENGEVSVTVKNVGEMDGDEVVLMYIRDPQASVTRPAKMLRGFQRVHLKAGESVRVKMPLGYKELRMTDINMQETVEEGEIEVMVGNINQTIFFESAIKAASPLSVRG